MQWGKKLKSSTAHGKHDRMSTLPAGHPLITMPIEFVMRRGATALAEIEAMPPEEQSVMVQVEGERNNWCMPVTLDIDVDPLSSITG